MNTVCAASDCTLDSFVRCSDRLPDKDGEYCIKHNCGCNDGNGTLRFSVEHGWDIPAMTSNFYRVIAWAPNAELSGGKAVRSDDLLERLARWIVQHPPEYMGDHACAQCYPHSDILKDGFVCAFHEAERIVNSSNAELSGQ